MSLKAFSRKAAAVILPKLIYLIMRLLWYTTFKRFHTITPVDERQHICVTWHGELLMTPQAYRKVHPGHKASAMISQHFDGEIIAGTLGMLKIRPLRGSSKRGAKKVLLEAFRSVRSGEEVLITPDGPRGPRHSMSDGAVALALKSKLPIFVMNYQCSSYWQLKSWDKFTIPKPFSRIDFYMQSVSLEGMEMDEAGAYLREKMMAHTIG